MFSSLAITRRSAALLCCIAVLSALGAQAQDLKPVKDKNTKKYGYQAKDKSWVIPPSYDNAKRFSDGFAEVEIGGRIALINQMGEMVFAPEYDDIGKFDKHGFCELTRKVDGTKYRGLGDRSGRIIIPLECRSVDVDRSGEFLYGKYETALPGFKPEQLWAVFDNEGRLLFKPSFTSTPSFYNGIGTARDAQTGLYGIIGRDGSILQPFKYFTISHFSGGFKGLGTDMTRVIWTEDLLGSQVIPQRGAVIPYDPQDDPVRAAAWHRGPVGIRLHRNTLKAAELSQGFAGIKVLCKDLSIDWGYGRFVRLEPCVVPAGTANAMYYGPANRYYTLKALLYEADGRFVKEICSCGWIEAECGEGALYNAGGQELWMVLANPNALALPIYTMNVTGYRAVNHQEVFSGLGISVSELSNLTYPYNYRDRLTDIFEGENIGICSYIPRVPSMSQARAERDAGRNPVFQYPFRMGEVVNCVVKKKDGNPKLELSDDLVCRFKDKLEDPYYTTKGGEEVIYWGPNNARTVGLSLEAAPKSAANTVDDVHNTGYSFRFVLSMYEEDGTWLRTLATAPYIDFIQDGIIVFEPLGIAMISPFGAKGPGKGQGPKPQAQPQPQAQTAGTNRSGHTGRTAVTETSGGSRNGGTPEIVAAPAPAPAASSILQPLPHTLSAVEAALRPSR